MKEAAPAVGLLPEDRAALVRAFHRDITAHQPIKVRHPCLPKADEILPFLREIDEARIYSNFGPLSGRFARGLAGLLGLDIATIVLTSSGTTGLIGAILACRRGRADQKHYAIVPALTFPAPAIAAERCGLEPLIVDVDPETWMLDPLALVDHPLLAEVAIVVVVAPYGKPVPQAPWQRFRAATGIPVVIDAAAAFSTIERRPADYLDDIPTVFSFHATKSFGIGEGGCVVSRSVELCAAVACAVNLGFFGARNSSMSSINGKMSEYHCAVGLAALTTWPEKKREYERTAGTYRSLMVELGLASSLFTAPEIDGSYTLFLCADADQARHVMRRLSENNIGTRLWYGDGVGGHAHFFSKMRGVTAASDDICRRLIGLPASYDLSPEDIGFICTTVYVAMHELHHEYAA